MNRPDKRLLLISVNILVLSAVALVFAGCVERLISVESEPAGAVVWLNGEEAGITPMSIRFQEYGEYEVLLRKDGYETIRQRRTANAPVYEWPGLDLISECLLPVTLVDQHEWQFRLIENQPSDVEKLTDRAVQLRARAVSQQ